MLQLQYFPLVLLLLLPLSGCFGGGHYAPVVERQQRLKVAPDNHTVSRGETLYSIAWRYNLDFRGLASTNGLASPFTIYPGQVIRLKRTAPAAKRVAAKPPINRTNKAAKSTKPSGRKPGPKVPVAVTTSRPLMSKKAYPFRWRWPAKGPTVRSYSSSSAVHKGIDIQGNLGEPVYAANSGKVVYAGSGLVGYGELLIIKHDEHYLSAYGHNRKLLVSEGEFVKVGQKIAEFGDTGTDKVKLHFEIRRDGKPVNPLGLLPRG
jgi:lipoprotein NlpD